MPPRTEVGLIEICNTHHLTFFNTIVDDLGCVYGYDCKSYAKRYSILIVTRKTLIYQATSVVGVFSFS